eukprot:jgi/Bigna1/142190/aug1.68_g16898
MPHAQGAYQSIKSLVSKISHPDISGDRWHRLTNTLLLTMVYVGSPHYVLELLIQLLTRPPASLFDHESYPNPEDASTLLNTKKIVISNSNTDTQKNVAIGDKNLEDEDSSQEGSKGTTSSFESSYTPPRTFSPSSLLGVSGFDIGDEVPIDSKTHEEIIFKYIQGLERKVASNRNPPDITSRAEFLKHKIKILNVFKKWAKSYPDDFIYLGIQEKNICKALQNTLKKFPPESWVISKGSEIRKSLEMVARVVLSSIDKAKLLADTKIQDSSSYQKLFKKCKWNKKNRAKKIAEQLTLLSIHRLSNAKAREFISGTTESNGAQTAISSQISDWVSTEILSQTGTPKMMLMLRLWIGIAYQCFLMRNYGSTFEIVYGITRHPVSRLEFLFNAMSQSTISNLQQMKEFISPVQNFRKYRQSLKDAVAKGVAVIPYFGVMTRDIFALENANPQLTIGYQHVAFVEKGKNTSVKNVTTCMLNIKRCDDLFQTINQTLRCRHSDYKFLRSPKLMKIIQTAAHEMVASEKQLSQLSETILPRRGAMKN